MNGFEVPLKQRVRKQQFMKKYMKNLHLPMFWGNLFKNRLLQAAVHENVHEKPSFGNVLRELIEKQVTSTCYIIPWRLRCPWSIWFCFSLTVKNACTQTESTLSWQRSLSYRNHLHERVKEYMTGALLLKTRAFS